MAAMRGRATAYREFAAADATNPVYSRTATYNTKSQLTQDVVDASSFTDGAHTTSYVYTDAQSHDLGVVTSATTTVGTGTNKRTIATTTNGYGWWDGAVQTSQSVVTTTGSDTTTGSSTFHYDTGGHLQSVYIEDGRARTVSFVTDSAGQVLSRDEVDDESTGDPRELHYYFDGVQVGDVSNDGTSDIDYVVQIAERTAAQGTGPFRGGSNTSVSYADFDQSYDPINGLNYDSTATRYTVQDGDTLEGIAQGLWGDASYWYMLADANGMDGTEPLAPGMSLIVPNKIHNSHNNADTYRVYDPNEAIGDTSPTAPKPPKHHKGCGVVGQILLVAVAVAVVAILHLPVTSFVAGGPFGFGAAATAAAAGATLGETIVAGAVIGAASSIASQGVGLATGIQDKFSFKAVAMSAIGGGVGASGLGGLAGSALTQGIGLATGLQNKFNWGSFAAAGVDGVLGASGFQIKGFGGQYLTNAATGIASAAAASLVTGKDFGDTLMSTLPGVIGQTIGDFAAREVIGRGPDTTSSGNGSQNDPSVADNANVQGNTASAAVIFDQAALDRALKDLHYKDLLDIAGGDPGVARGMVKGEFADPQDTAPPAPASSPASPGSSSNLVRGVHFSGGVRDGQTRDAVLDPDGPYSYDGNTIGRYEQQSGKEADWVINVARTNSANAALADFDRSMGYLGLASVSGGLLGFGATTVIGAAGLTGWSAVGAGVALDGLNAGVSGLPMHSALGQQNTVGTFATDLALGAGAGLALRGGAAYLESRAAVSGADETAVGEVVDLPSGSFSISDWSGYPAGVPRPQGPFQIVEGAEYNAARSAADKANRLIRREQGLVGQPLDVHEIQPVKFGGSPTDLTNKVILPRDAHRPVTSWWNQLQKDLGH